MTFKDVPVLASLSSRAFGLRRRPAAPALRPLPQEWDRKVVIAAPQARDLVQGTGDRSA